MDTLLPKPDVHIAHFPTYSNARTFLKVIEGTARSTVMGMRESLLEQRGTPQDARDWSEPDLWIPVVLSGQEQVLANRLWHESQGKLNPRHITAFG